MIFTFTMNMPSRKESLVHQVHGDYPVNSLDELNKVMATTDFLTVDEYYIHGSYGQSCSLENKGKVSINLALVGKVKVWVDHAKR